MTRTIKTTPKDFFIWAGALVALYWSIYSFVWLMFGYIDTAFRSPFNTTFSDPYTSGTSFLMASLVVFLPVFLTLMSLIRKDLKARPEQSTFWVRRWAIMITLFISGLVFAGDLVYVLQEYFSGSTLNIAFALKAILLGLVASVTFMHFIADHWGFWEENPSSARRVAYGVGLLGALTVVAGFLIYGTPQEVRKYRIDNQKVNDLQSIQYQILAYHQGGQILPAELSEAYTDASAGIMPYDTDLNVPYKYTRTSTTTFELCATFNRPSTYLPSQIHGTYPARYEASLDQWFHDQGHVCFHRVIDPKLYGSIDRKPLPMIQTM